MIGHQHASSKTYAVWRWAKILLVMWLCMKMGGCLLAVPGPWGPKIGGKLPNSHSVYFQARPVGRETDDRLIWLTPNGRERHFWVDQIHAGFGHVTLKYVGGGDRVWVEADGKVGASINLTDGDFRSEDQPQHDWAVLGTGETLSAGSTGNILWLIGPW